MKMSILFLSLLFVGACTKDSIPVGKSSATQTKMQLLTDGTGKTWVENLFKQVLDDSSEVIKQDSANVADHWIFRADNTFEIDEYQFHGEMGGWPSNSILFISGRWQFNSDGQSIECSDVIGSDAVNSTFVLGILALTDNNLQVQLFDFFKSEMNGSIEFDFSAQE